MDEGVWNKISQATPKAASSVYKKGNSSHSSSNESVKSKTLRRFSTLRITKSTEDAAEFVVIKA